MKSSFFSKILFLSIFSLFLSNCKSTQNHFSKTNPKTESWISLFNEKDLTGWDVKFTGSDLNDNYKNTFRAEDGILKVRYDNYTNFEGKFGHLYYKTPYAHYKLVFDYRFVGEQIEGGWPSNNRNSGVMLHSQSAKSNEYNQNFPVSVEFQTLGGLKDNKERPTANVCTPGTTIVYNDNLDYKHCINSTSKTYFGDQWVHAEAIVKGGESMTFIIENDTVLQFKNPQIGKTFPNKKWKSEKWTKWGMNKKEWEQKAGQILKEGYIALQAESQPVDFKNIKLLDLCGCTDPNAKNYKSYYTKNKKESCKY